MRIDVPTGALQNNSSITLIGRPVDASRQAFTAYEFSLTGISLGDGSPISSFALPAAHTLRFPSDPGPQAGDYSLAWFNADGNYWYANESSFDGGTLTLTSSMIQLGIFELAADPLLVEGENEKIIYPDEGGTLTDESGTVRVAFTSGDVTERIAARVEMVDRCRQHPAQNRILREFELEATAIDRGDAVVSVFAQPVELTATHSLDEMIAFAPGSLKLYLLDEASGEWNEIGAQSDPGGGTVTASIDHFSIYSSQGLPEIIRPPDTQYFQVDMQSGSSTVNIPINLPTGPGGIVPQLSLNYSSSAVDEMKTKATMGSWAGIGWNVGLPTITRDPFGRPIPDPNNPPSNALNGRYFLSMNGVSDLLVRENSAIPSGPQAGRYRFHTKRETYLDITGISCNHTGQGVDSYYEFFVRTKDGTEYQFGNKPGSGQACWGGDQWTSSFPTSLQFFTRYWANPAGWHRYHYRMDVSRMTDPRGNRIDFTYWQDIRSDCFTTPCKSYVRAAYPSVIQWGANAATGGGHMHEVLFNGADFSGTNQEVGGWDEDYPSGVGRVRLDAPLDSVSPFCVDPHVMDTRRLTNIHVRSFSTTVRAYSFGYHKTSRIQSAGADNCPAAGVLRLDSVTEKGLNGVPVFRTMNFGYTNSHVVFKKAGHIQCASRNDVAFGQFMDRPYLVTASNGFGGQVTYGYQEKWSQDPNPNWCTWTRNAVIQRNMQSGVGLRDGLFEIYGYDYPSSFGPHHFFGPDMDAQDAEYRGFSRVIENRPLNQAMQCDYHVDNYLVGSAIDCRWFDHGVTIRTVTNAYDLREACKDACNAWEPYWQYRESWFVRHNVTNETVWGRRDKGTSYLYDNYGNVTDTCEYQFFVPFSLPNVICPNGYYRRSISSFAGTYASPPSTQNPNYIVNLPYRTLVYDAANSEKSRTEYYYDGALNLVEQLPWKGLLARLDRYSNTTAMRAKDYTYDPFGNMTSEWTYREQTTASPPTCVVCFPTTIDPTACGNTRTLSVTNAANQTTTHTYDCVLGVVTGTTDANNATHATIYDDFGRPDKEWGPGDTPQQPTVDYTYFWDGVAPNHVNIDRREQGAETLGQVQRFDGFGRLLQVLHERGGTAVSTVDTVYDAVGKKAWDTIPYDSSCHVNAWPGCVGSVPKTVYDYDALGRVTRVTNPDNSSRTMAYVDVGSEGAVSTIDERQHKTDFWKDSFDRTFKVDEYSGEHPNSAFWASTNYSYDVMDRLTQVRDWHNNTTNINYDKAGWKLDMTDPDSGYWSYTYYNDGLLKTQTDPRLEVSTMAYDSLGRLDLKSYSGPISASAIDYIYDVCAITPCSDSNHKGRLSKVFDWAGEHRYKYDPRGRPTKEEHVVSGTTYGISHGYDSLDRETSTMYPDGEVVSRSFDSQGMTETVSGSASNGQYLNASDYNAAGKPTRHQLGASPNAGRLDVRYDYRPSDLRLRSICAVLAAQNENPCVPTGPDLCPTTSSADRINVCYRGYDGRGNITSILDTRITGTGVSQTMALGYDHRDRLTSVSGPYSSSYQYDPIGNMTQKSEGPANGSREIACLNHTDDDGDQLINDGCTTDYSSLCYGSPGCSSGRPHAVKSTTGNNPNFAYNPNFTASYSYDQSGNLLSVTGANGAGGSAGSLDILLRLEHLGEGYDAEGRLHKIEYNKLDLGSDIAFYDVTDDCLVDISDTSRLTGANGLGVGQTGYNARYDLNSDGWIDISDISTMTGNVYGKFCPRFVYDADGNLTKIEGHGGGPPPKRMVYIGGIYEKNLDSGEVTKYYSANGKNIATRKGNNVYHLVADHLGGTAVTQLATGGTTQAIRYYPYGQPWTEENGTPFTDKLFTGQRRYGRSSGIYHYGARFYSADVGRFLSPDSIVPGAGNPQSLNRYAYVLNNPLKYGDPTGNKPDPECTMSTCGNKPRPPGGSGGGGGVGGTGGGAGGAPSLPPHQPVTAPAACSWGSGACCTIGGVESSNCMTQPPPPGGGSGFWFELAGAAGGFIPFVGEGDEISIAVFGCSYLEWRCGYGWYERGASVAFLFVPVASTKHVRTADNLGDALRALGRTDDFSDYAAHWTKHRREFPEFLDAEEYRQNALRLANQPEANDNILIGMRSDGTKVIYERSTNTIVFSHGDGNVGSQFRPDRREAYFWQEVGR